MLAHSIAGLQLELGPALGAVLVAGIGALAPDIDHPHATISNGIPKMLITGAFKHFLWPMFVLVSVLAIGPILKKGPLGVFETIQTMYQSPYAQLMINTGIVIIGVGLVFIFASILISTLFEHRGATHSLLFALGATIFAIVGSILLNIAWWYGLLFGWGWISHLIADATTEMGLPALFWPFSSDRFHSKAND